MMQRKEKISLRVPLDKCIERFLAISLVFEHLAHTGPHCNGVICKLFQHFYNLLILVLSADVNIVPRFACSLFFIESVK